MFPNRLVFSGLLAGLVVLPGGCSTGPLSVKEVFFCDQVQNGECSLPWSPGSEETRIYKPAIPEAKLRSWFDLGYHMYFHTRQTPGLRVVFSRPLTAGELTEARNQARCHYRIDGGGSTITGELEGVRLDDDGRALWCFDYLGSKLVRLARERGRERSPPETDIFPLSIELSFEGLPGGLTGSKRGLVRVLWYGTPQKKSFN
ncbi:MAG: hypothetical protein H7A21_15805 [Spirochaetales bacterium]|nr:hypothetical protein [Leptospiraceae bacterium]MCP5482902.1 hypothetical protein [Spirochaetales bacterium]